MTYLDLLYKLDEKKDDQQRPFISLNSTVSAWEECFDSVNWYYDSLRVAFTNWTAEIHDQTAYEG
jgi:hypothetical protein